MFVCKCMLPHTRAAIFALGAMSQLMRSNRDVTIAGWKLFPSPSEFLREPLNLCLEESSGSSFPNNKLPLVNLLFIRINNFWFRGHQSINTSHTQCPHRWQSWARLGSRSWLLLLSLKYTYRGVMIKWESNRNAFIVLGVVHTPGSSAMPGTCCGHRWASPALATTHREIRLIA